MLCKVMSNSEGVSGLALDMVESPAKEESCQFLCATIPDQSQERIGVTNLKKV